MFTFKVPNVGQYVHVQGSCFLVIIVMHSLIYEMLTFQSIDPIVLYTKVGRTVHIFFRGWVAKSRGWVAKSGDGWLSPGDGWLSLGDGWLSHRGWVAKSRGWVAKS